jgi:hypothetical protein
MARDSNGNYTLPAGNPVVSGEVISTGWANPTLSDIANELTNSLDRQGRGGMLAPFKFTDGTSSAPGISWSSEPSSGLYRAGSGDMRATIAGVPRMRWTSTGVDVWDSVNSVWIALTNASGSNLAFLTAANVYTATPQQLNNAAGTIQVVNALPAPTSGVRIGLAQIVSSPSVDIYTGGAWRALLYGNSSEAVLRGDTVEFEDYTGAASFSVAATQVYTHNGRPLNILAAGDATGISLASDGALNSNTTWSFRIQGVSHLGLTATEFSLVSGLRQNFYDSSNANFFNVSNVGNALQWNSSAAGASYVWQVNAASAVTLLGGVPNYLQIGGNTRLQLLALNGTTNVVAAVDDAGPARWVSDTSVTAYQWYHGNDEWVNLTSFGMLLYSKGAALYHDNGVLQSGRVIVSDQPAPSSGYPPGTVWLQV